LENIFEVAAEKTNPDAYWSPVIQSIDNNALKNNLESGAKEGLCIGSRVRRGPDWRRDDIEGPVDAAALPVPLPPLSQEGTVLTINMGGCGDRVLVQWDKDDDDGQEALPPLEYRWGAIDEEDGLPKYDLELIPSENNNNNNPKGGNVHTRIPFTGTTAAAAHNHSNQNEPQGVENNTDTTEKIMANKIYSNLLYNNDRRNIGRKTYSVDLSWEDVHVMREKCELATGKEVFPPLNVGNVVVRGKL